MNWTPGPARCRSDKYEAEILATDMGGNHPYLGRFRPRGDTEWEPVLWSAEGLSADGIDDKIDLMPPTITREALAEECTRVWLKNPTPHQNMASLVAHVIDAVKAGRVE